MTKSRMGSFWRNSCLTNDLVTIMLELGNVQLKYIGITYQNIDTILGCFTDVYFISVANQHTVFMICSKEFYARMYIFYPPPPHCC